MNILFTLCGRAGSKGVKGKNVRDFCGVPLVLYSLAAIELYRERYAASDDVCVALNTDSEELIGQAADRVRMPLCLIRREAALGTDNAPKVLVIRDCLVRACERLSRAFDIVVDLDITSPLRTVDDIHSAVCKKIQHPQTDVVFSVAPARRNPYFNMVKEENGSYVRAIASQYTTRQQAPVFYDMNASIYAYSPAALRNKPAISFFSDNTDIVLMRDTGILDIDSEEDYELMQVIARYFFSCDEQFHAIKKRADLIAFAEGPVRE